MKKVHQKPEAATMETHEEKLAIAGNARDANIRINQGRASKEQ